ncbi:glycoside hydrolase family 43 protein [Xylariaceae sp. AK1471]|nr:glycoside hydrolase family 43 protein [Xylariaceae sp. AK1471]
MHHQPYDDSTLTLTSVGTPDPFVNKFRSQYYLTFTTGDKIEIWSSSNLADIERTSTKHQIWTPPHGSNHSADLWAPELHALHGRWYIYYAAASPERGNKSHRMYVLGGPAATEDPCSGQWEFLGRIYGMPDQWAIDGTVFELEGQLYLAYSGWPLDNNSNNSTTKNKNNSGLVQQLFLMRLDDPTMANSRPVAISLPTQPWEITRDQNGAHAINEGPQWLSSPDGRWRGLVYSCAGSWTHEYKMATLEYLGGAPLDASSWQKSKAALLQTPTRKRSGNSGPFGPGHGSFLDVGNGNVIAVYHATDSPSDGWENRRARVQRVAFTEKGPYMGRAFGVEGLNKSGLVARIRARLGTKVRCNSNGKEALRALLDGRNMQNGATVDDDDTAT